MTARIKSTPQEMPMTTFKGNCFSVGADVGADNGDNHDDGYDENDRRKEDHDCINIIS